MKQPGFAQAYEALADEFAVLGELLRARKQAGMTQADVAASMGIAQASVARLESSARSCKHAPSIATLPLCRCCGLRPADHGQAVKQAHWRGQTVVAGQA